MQSALHVTTHVLPGNRIEVSSPELPTGAVVDVFVVLRNAVETRPQAPRRSVLDIVKSLGGHRLFQTPEEADRYLAEERSSWER